VFAGRYGPYVQHGKLRATLPKSIEPESLTMDEALELLSAKAAKDAPAKKAAVKKTSAASEDKPVVKKAAPKKAATKKATPKKATVKKASKET